MSGLNEKLKTHFGDSVTEIHDHCGDETAVVVREALMDVMNFVKTDPGFEMNVLIDLTAVDGLKQHWKPRFEVVYHLYSMRLNHRLRIKVRVEEKDAAVPTLTGLWPIANWLEREVWDMFGVKFDGHPDLRRILMYEEFQGHPLRKDYPFNKRQPLIGPKN